MSDTYRNGILRGSYFLSCAVECFGENIEDPPVFGTEIEAKHPNSLSLLLDSQKPQISLFRRRHLEVKKSLERLEKELKLRAQLDKAALSDPTPCDACVIRFRIVSIILAAYVVSILSNIIFLIIYLTSLKRN
ncbi:hypothetical protein DFJ63DRAFT_312516 [Scheffersomyces coipomensis]|uniref:uncharacterized protein n=1 Tax=Scheffersomyces coipomensis TaxID=1788519 RepID=UPI00315C9C99